MKNLCKKINWNLLENDLKRAKIEYADFNVFKVLNIVNAEIRHSRIIAWLFNPKGTHNQGKIYLKKLLKYVDKIKNNKRKLLASSKGLDETTVECEHFVENKEIHNGYIDILIVNKKSKFVIVIENKINSKEHEQLEIYREYIEQKYSGYDITYVYLHKNDEELKEKNYRWKQVTYEDLFNNIFEGIKKSNDTEEEKFVNNYRLIFSEEFNMNTEQKRKCIKFFKKYSKELSTIYSYAEKDGLLDKAPWIEVVDSVFEDYKNKIIVDDEITCWRRSFFTKELDKYIGKIKRGKNKNNGGSWKQGICYGYWFSLSGDVNENLKLTFEVGDGKEERSDELTKRQHRHIDKIRKYMQQDSVRKNKPKDIEFTHKKNVTGRYNQLFRIVCKDFVSLKEGRQKEVVSNMIDTMLDFQNQWFKKVAK